jgi:hypothetical protein
MPPLALAQTPKKEADVVFSNSLEDNDLPQSGTPVARFCFSPRMKGDPERRVPASWTDGKKIRKRAALFGVLSCLFK